MQLVLFPTIAIISTNVLSAVLANETQTSNSRYDHFTVPVSTTAPTSIFTPPGFHSTVPVSTTSPTSILSLSPSFSSSSTTLAPSVLVPECWDNTTHIYNHLYIKTPYTSFTYVLCPNTVFYIGYYTDNNGCCQNGDQPLYGSANVKYMCGKDGESSNNCTLVGGTVQVVIDKVAFKQRMTNLVFQGITFQAAGNYVSLPFSPGNFTFIDCIFQDHKTLGLFVMLNLESFNNRRRRLADGKGEMKDMDSLTKLSHSISDDYLQEIWEYYSTRKDVDNYSTIDTIDGPRLDGTLDRDLQSSNGTEYTKLIGNWRNCIFRNNEQGPTKQFAEITDGLGLSTFDFITFGMVTSVYPQNIMNFDGCLFQNNDYESSGQVNGYAIKSIESAVSIRNSCFVNNNFAGAGPVQVLYETQVQFNNVYGTADEKLICQFIAFNTGNLSTPMEVNCTDYDATSCELFTFAEVPGEAQKEGSTSIVSSASNTKPDRTVSGSLQSAMSAAAIGTCLVTAIAVLLTDMTAGAIVFNYLS